MYNTDIPSVRLNNNSGKRFWKTRWFNILVTSKYTADTVVSCWMRRDRGLLSETLNDMPINNLALKANVYKYQQCGCDRFACSVGWWDWNAGGGCRWQCVRFVCWGFYILATYVVISGWDPTHRNFIVLSPWDPSPLPDQINTQLDSLFVCCCFTS